MYSHSDIEDAVEGGALSAEQAAGLRNFVARRNGTPTADEEPVRWLLGFNDMYVYASSIMLLFGLGWLGYKIGGGSGDAAFLIPLIVALACWGLSEFFVKRKKLALTGINLAVIFVYCVFFTIILLAAEVLGPSDRATGQLVSAVAALLAAGAAFLHWKRFAEPVAFALIVGSLAIALMSLLALVLPRDPDSTVSFIVMILIGLATLVYAQTWEAKDIHRTTRKGEIGFWIHWVAAFEVAIGLVGLLGLMGYNPSSGAAIGGIVAFLVLILIGIVLDRRIWVLMGAWPGGVGIYTLIKGDPMSAYGSDGGAYGGSPYGYSPYMGIGDTIDNVSLTLLILGVVLILIGMFWTQIRGALGALAGPLAGKVPPTRAADGQGQAFE